MKRMTVSNDLDVRTRPENFRVDRPFRVPSTFASYLFSFPINQHEVVWPQHLTKTDPVALHPEAAPSRITQRHVTKGHVAMTLHLQNTARPRNLSQRFTQVRLKAEISHENDS